MERTSAAHSISSSRVVGKKRPLGTAPRQWPARPKRWRETPIDRGEPICSARSTWPMSIPSSSEAVATRTFSSPFLSLLSASRRSLRARHVFAHPFRQIKRHALSQPSRVYKNQRGTVLLHQFADAVIDLVP